MELDAKTVRDVAGLANVTLSPADLERLAAQLNRVLQAFAELQQVDTSGVVPTYHTPVLSARRRPDQPAACLGPAGLAPADRQDDLVRVPAVLT